MKLVSEKAYTATAISVEQLLLMNQTELLNQYPFYAIEQTGPIGKMEEFIQYASKLYQNTHTTTPVTNNVVIWALSAPVEAISVVSENLSSQGLTEDNNYTNSVGDLSRD